MAASRRRTFVSLACLLAGLLGAGGAYRWLRERQQESIEFVAPELEEQGGEWIWERDYIQHYPQTTLQRFELTEEQTRLLLPQLRHEWNRFDPLMYFGYEPGLDQYIAFDEHPAGGYRVRTNSLGMRRDTEVSSEKPDWRILVAGDSHADGVCNNSETFSALLEVALEARTPASRVEVLNAARGGQSPFNYLGTLEKFADLEPDVFLLWFTGSNDFVDPLYLGRVFRGHPRLGLPEEVEALRERAREVDLSLYTAGIHSASYFLSQPEQVDYSLALCRDILLEVSLVCRDKGIEPWIVYLPPPAFLIPRERLSGLAPMLEILGFSLEPLAQQAATMGAKFRELCASLELPCLDLEPALARDVQSCFYPRDLHLCPAGQRVVCAALLADWQQRHPR